MEMIMLTIALVVIALLAGVGLGCFMAFMVAVRMADITYDYNEKNNENKEKNDGQQL